MPGKKQCLNATAFRLRMKNVRQFTKNRIVKQGGIYENLIVILLLWWKYAPCFARHIQKILGCDVQEILTVTPYSGDYNSVVSQENRKWRKDTSRRSAPLIRI